MANLKNITELPVANSADGLNLIVNDSGTAKQIAASKVGAQADWSVTDNTNPAFIKNKPTIPAAQVQADWNVTNDSSPAFIKNKPTIPKPLILDANLSDYYGGHVEAGDEALEAIKTGRQILVRVPNADGGTNTAIYCPIMMHQVPLNGYYLYLFYLRDEKQDLSALLGQPAGTILMPTYGQFKMLLSKNYDSNPIE